MLQIGKKKTIGTIVIVAAISAAIGISVSDARRAVHDPQFICYATRGDTTVALAVADSAFIAGDSLLLLQQKKGSDTTLALAPVSIAPLIANDSTVLSQDTLTDVRVIRKK